MSEVFLKCVKEGSKLRIKIISSGFFNEANCQFPKNIRVEEGPNQKFFYRINKSYIKIIPETILLVGSEPIEKIFEDESIIECMVCMNYDKDIVFAKCGHYVCCEECSMTIFRTTKKCPICRAEIYEIVKREFIQI